MAYKQSGNEWAFQGNSLSEPVYEDNFEDEINAIAEDAAGDGGDMNAIAEGAAEDSGYYSNDTESPKPSFYESTHLQHFYTDAAASNGSNHGPIYHGTQNKSTTHLEKAVLFKKQAKETRMSKTVHHPVHDRENRNLHRYSSLESEVGDQRPLKLWETTSERHEWLAYRLQRHLNAEPTERRRTGRKK